MRDVLRGCEGFANMADGIIVYGCDVDEHDEHLVKVPSRLAETGVTLNRVKCQFRLSEITFFGHHLTSVRCRASLQPDRKRGVSSCVGV